MMLIFFSLTTVQCQQLIQMLTTQLGSATIVSSDISPSGPTVSNFAGNNPSISFSAWIIDIGATHHVCCE